MALPTEALDLIKRFEGCLRRIPDGRYAPYLCPANVPTVGWGTTTYDNGRRVALKDEPITAEECDRHFAHELRDNEAAVDRLTATRLHPFMRGALVSFVYNCGSGAYQGSTLRRRVNDGEWDDVPRELAKWRMGGGRVLPGLVRRRADEGKLFLRGAEALRQGNGVVTTVPAAPPLDRPVEAAAPPSPPLTGSGRIGEQRIEMPQVVTRPRETPPPESWWQRIVRRWKGW